MCPLPSFSMPQGRVTKHIVGAPRRRKPALVQDHAIDQPAHRRQRHGPQRVADPCTHRRRGHASRGRSSGERGRDDAPGSSQGAPCVSRPPREASAALPRRRPSRTRQPGGSPPGGTPLPRTEQTQNAGCLHGRPRVAWTSLTASGATSPRNASVRCKLAGSIHLIEPDLTSACCRQAPIMSPTPSRVLTSSAAATKSRMDKTRLLSQEDPSQHIQRRLRRLVFHTLTLPW